MAMPPKTVVNDEPRSAPGTPQMFTADLGADQHARLAGEGHPAAAVAAPAAPPIIP